MNYRRNWISFDFFSGHDTVCMILKVLSTLFFLTTRSCGSPFPFTFHLGLSYNFLVSSVLTGPHLFLPVTIFLSFQFFSFTQTWTTLTTIKSILFHEIPYNYEEGITIRLRRNIWTSCVSELTSSVLNWSPITCMGHSKIKYQVVRSQTVSLFSGFLQDYVVPYFNIFTLPVTGVILWIFTLWPT
jgi:hypothetical protein